MNSNRRCSHCGELGHNSRTCQEGAVKLFGVTLNHETPSDMPRSASAGNLARPPTSPDSASQPGRDAPGFRYRASPLGRDAPVSAVDEAGAPLCRLTEQLGPDAAVNPFVPGPVGVQPQASVAERSVKREAQEEVAREEPESRIEHVRDSGTDDEADGTKLLQTDERMLSGEGDGYLSDNGGGPDLAASASKERKKGVAWTEEEHRLFLLGLSKLGKGDWRGISRNFVQTRTPTQVASHAQKYFIRQNNINKRKRRASLLDISTDSINADTGMLRSHSTPSLPSLVDDFKQGSGNSAAAASGSGLSAFPLPGTPSFPKALTGTQGFSPSFEPNSPDIKVADAKLMEHMPLHKPQDYMSYPPPPTPSAFCNPPPLYSGHMASYQHDPAGFLSAGFRPPNPYIDFGRSHSYPVVAAPGVATEVSSLSRPNSMPIIGLPGSLRGAPPGYTVMEGMWPPAGSTDPMVPSYWSPMQESGGKRAGGQDSQALSTLDPATRHRLGHEMMMEMMGRQFSHSMAADFNRRQASGVPTAGYPGIMGGMTGDLEVERRSKMPRVSSLHGTGLESSPMDIPLSHGSPYMPPISSSPQGCGAPCPESMCNSSGAAAAGAASAAAAAASPPGGPQPGPISPWYMGPAYNTWLAQYGAVYRPPASGMMPPHAWGSLPQLGDAAKGKFSPGATQDVKLSTLSVLRPTALVPTAPVSVPKATETESEGTETRDSEQEPAAVLVMLSKGMEATSPPAKEKMERATPLTLQLFDVSERPSAFHPQQCPASRLSPEGGDVVKSPISVP